MSSAGRAPTAYPKVGRTQRRSASSPSPTEPTPACRSVSPGMKAREYRRKAGERKAAVRPRRDPWPRADRARRRDRYAERRSPTGRPVMEWRRPFTRRNGKRTTFAEDGTSACWPSRHRPRPMRMYAASSQGLADSLEAERPLRGGRREPLLCLGEQSLAAARGRGHVLLEGADRVLEHGEHEPLLGLKGCVDLEAIEELRRKDGLGLQPRTSRLVEPSRCLRFHRCLLPLRCQRSSS